MLISYATICSLVQINVIFFKFSLSVSNYIKFSKYKLVTFMIFTATDLNLISVIPNLYKYQ